jgi:hypothetical protein
MRPLFVALFILRSFAAEPIKPAKTPPDPAFNRYNDYSQVVELLRGYAAAYPDWVRLESIGKTLGGRDTWLLTVNNPKTGPAAGKPAFLVDAAIHANEIQATETVLYSINYLLKNYGKLPRVTEALDRAVFHFVPMVSPDSREKWFKEPSTANYPRTVQVRIDDDRDGRIDEDGYDDLDGNNIITQMRKKVPLGEGTHRLDPKDPRILVAVQPGERGDYILLGIEGYDNDGDGQVNEDPVGYIDPNRTGGYQWQPRYVQNGSSDYPLQIPETRNIAEWALAHPNIIANLSYHNTGRYILRGPGSKAEPRYMPSDLRTYDFLGKEGEKLLPGYRYGASGELLYTVYGGTTDHFHGVVGAVSMVLELFGQVADFNNDKQVSEQERMKFNDDLAQGRQFVDWKEVEHPQYGKIEVGGYRHDTGRIPEGWQLEEECHRNLAFLMLVTHHLPKLRFHEPVVERVEGSLYKIRVTVENERAIPSMLAVSQRLKRHRLDVATLEGAKVLAGGLAQNAYLNRIDFQSHRPARLLVPGVEGFGTRTLYYLVEGQGEVTITYDSLKAGKITQKLRLP